MSTSSPTEPTDKRSPDESTEQLELPPLTPAIIQRAKEGLDAARDRDRQLAAQVALDRVEEIAQNRKERQINGKLRRFVLRSLIHTLFDVRVEYPENIPTQRAMLAPNHLSHFDPLLLLSVVPAAPFYYILGDARTLYNNWWKRYILGLSEDTIPLDRLWKEEIAVIEGAKTGREDLAELAAAIEQDVPNGSSIDALRRLDRIIQAIFARGDGMIMFPEGRLGAVEGQLRLPLKRGTVIYALRAGVPIVPVAIVGTQDLYLRKKLTIRFGKPLIFPQSHRPKSREIQTAIDSLQAALIELLQQENHDSDWVKLWRSFLNHLLW